ncbi:MAG: DUF885 domain-containing protein [Phycisphaerae bacterium]
MRVTTRLGSLFVLSGVFTAAAAADSEAARLQALFDEHQEWRYREYPELAMAHGDYRYSDRVSDTNIEAIERRHTEEREFLERLHKIDRAALRDPESLYYELFELSLRDSLEGHEFRTFLAPIGGRFGPQQEIPQMHERVRFARREDYENYLKRLEQTPQVVENTLGLLERGLDQHRTPPKVSLQGVPEQFRMLLNGGLDALATPLENPAPGLAAADLAELKERFFGRVLPDVRAAMSRLGDYFTNEYLPRCRESIAATDWPDGEAFYAYSLRSMTTTDLTARQIHEIGLREVARIRAEMMTVIRATDFLKQRPDAATLDDAALFKAFVEYLRTDSRFYHKSPEALLAGYRDVCKRIDAGLPKLFKTLPRLPYGVREIPAFMAPAQTTAYYQHGDIANGEPGYFCANTYALEQRPKYEMIALAMHEAVPGHHLQIALAQELDNVPEFRRDAWFHAFGEGWALYSERLGLEMNLYADPYDNFGRLTYEMWRACRLVVDPGMHALGWTRERAVRFMLDNTALSELNINNEIDRYIAWPGQATTYKIGELKIRELRERAEKKLGERFDVRAFHEVVLGAGAIPLGILEKRVDAWIARDGR